MKDYGRVEGSVRDDGHDSLNISKVLTCALAVFHVRLQLPAFITRAFHAELVLLAALTALQVFGTKTLNLTCLIV